MTEAAGAVVATLSDETMQRFLDVADSLAFLAGKYGDTAEEIADRRTAQLDWVVASWCSEEAEDTTVALLVDVRATHRDPESTPAPEREHWCAECGHGFPSARGLSIHRSRLHALPTNGNGHAAPPAGAFTCPSCGRVFSRQNGLSRHLSQSHGALADRQQPTAEPVVQDSGIVNREPEPGFDGHHRLARMHRDGPLHRATCGCGFVTEGYADADGAKSELREHAGALVGAP